MLRMTLRSPFSGLPRSLALLGVGLLTAVLVGACATGATKVPQGTSQPDKFLFERGTEALNKKKWLTSREYFRTLIDTYPQSPYRAEAKLGLGDSFLGEGTAASQILAINEYREFLAFFPTHARADYAQYKMAMGHFYQMAKPERDQTETREALKEFETFFERYPNSKLMPEVRKHFRETRDRLSESEFRAGFFYYRARWYPGAVGRLQPLLKADPEFTNRDAVYFYLAASLAKLNRSAEAVPYLQKLQDEFLQSEYLDDAQKLIAEMKAAPATATSLPPKSLP